ncbi:SPOR domain-containing protein [Sphingomicrobium arenosum]|uniref:SPOR domain-containing protein n=1 Tax=Sphingomicrobium arenosum TaxID=2233861 RepID=UPI00223EC86E|nr:SPOR domain-containing protein [Sphingomicrobium arenosum]
MRQHPTRSRRASRALTAALALLLAGTAAPALAAAQASPVDELTGHLTQLDSNPRDLAALVGAGEAALAIGDLPSAAGFFGRAAEVSPDDPRVLMGQGAVAVQMNDPALAMQYFAAAQGRGGSAVQMGASRGLAHDLLGQTREAEADYRAAMAGPRANDARRRLALNLAMGGDRTAAMALLNPLIADGDPAALRARAFVLALTGDIDNARRAIEAAMPGSGAAIDPFLRRLPSLTAPQKAAAVHLGVFPTGNAMAAATPTPAPPPARVPEPVRVASADSRPNPPAAPSQARVEPTARTEVRRDVAGTPSTPGEQVRPRDDRPIEVVRVEDDRYATRSGLVAPGAIRARPTTRRTARAQEEEEASLPPPPPAPSPIVAQPQAAPTSAPDTTTVAAAQQDAPRLAGLDATLRRVPADTRNVRAAAPPPPPQPKYDAPPPPTPKVETARPAPRPTPAAPDIGVEGSWFVQLAGSDNRGAMDYEWRRLKRKALGTLSDHEPLLTRGVDFHRLLVGPFAGRSEAQALVNTLKAEGVDSYAWRRDPAQLRIDPL